MASLASNRFKISKPCVSELKRIEFLFSYLGHNDGDVKFVDLVDKVEH